MNGKKLLALLLTGALCLSLAHPALAAEEDGEDGRSFTTEDGALTILITPLEGSGEEEDTATDSEEENTGAGEESAGTEEPGAWYDEAVSYVTAHGIMTGTEYGFEAESLTDRASVYQTLYNLEGRPAVEWSLPEGNLSEMVYGQSSRAVFEADVTGKWFETSAKWAYTVGLTTGDETGAYNGERPITRGELVTVLYRYARYQGMNVATYADLSAYSDTALIPEWANAGFRWAVARGVIQGYEEGRLDPYGNASRAQLATILMRFDRLEDIP